MKTRTLSFLAVAWSWYAGTSPVQAESYSITDLGALNGAATYATAINDHGIISGFAQPDANSAHAWLWKSGHGFTDVGSFGGADNRALALGADDTLFGYSQNSSGVARGFSWNGTALTDLGSIAAGDAVFPQGVNASGVVVGYTNTSGTTLAFKLDGGTMTALDPLLGADPGATSAAYGINDAGQIVGVAGWVAGGTRAFRTDAAGMPIPLGTLGGNDSLARAINASGQVVGYSTTATGETHAFIFNVGAGLRDLGVLSGGHDSRAYGIDNAGELVGSATDSAGNPHAFLWTPGPAPLHDLNDLIPPTSGWVLEEARGINNSGDIVGVGVTNGQEHAFLLEAFNGPDTTPPIAITTVGPITPGATSYQIVVKFWDNEKVVSATARAAGTIRVSGPNGYDLPGTATSWTTNDSQVVNVTFNFPAPGGSWDPSDNGTYEIHVAFNRVSDLAGNRIPGGVIGTFSVGLQTAPTLTLSGLAAAAPTDTPVSLTLTATSSYPSSPSDVFTFTIDWNGDASDVQTVNGQTGLVVQHTYTDAGARTVRVHCVDPHGVQSADSTATIAVAFSVAPLPPAEVLATQVSQIGTAGTVAAVNGSTMYFFGPPFTATSATTVATWNYLTPDATFTVAGTIGGDSQLYAGAAVDSRGRVILFGGSNGDSGAVASARSYPSAGSVAPLPAAIATAVTTTDSLGRIYAYSAPSGAFFRYTAGTSGAGSWETLPSPGGGAAAMSYDGGDHVILFTSPPSVYSISGNAWTQPFNSPAAFNRAVPGADGLIYLIAPNVIWEFDPVLNTFAQTGTTTYDQSSSLVLKGTDGFIYLIGGGGGGFIERFDTRPPFTFPPRISSSPGNTTIVQGIPWTYTIAASGKPRPAFSLGRGPDGMTVDSTTGVVSWTPTLAQVGPQVAVVRATNSAGTAGQLIAFNVLTTTPDTTPPTPPTNVVVSDITVNSADITWSPGTDDVGVVGYRLYKRVVIHDPKGSGSTVHYVLIASTTGTSLHLSGLSPVTVYPYFLVSVDAAGNQSTYAAAGFTSGNMSAPGIANGNNGPFAGPFAIVGEPFTSYTFIGTGVPQPTFTVVSAPAGAVWNPSQFATSGYFTWTPAAGQESDATFTLSATNSSGTVTQSYTVHVYPAGTDLVPPAPVTGVVVDQITFDSCRVTWTPTTDNHAVTAYHVTATHRDPGARFHPGVNTDQVISVDLPATTTQTTLTGLHPDIIYAVTVTAGDAAGLWSYVWAGSGALIRTLPIPFPVPNVMQTLNADGSLTMTWPGHGYYWQFTVQCTDTLNPPNWQPAPPAAQWPSYATTFTIIPDPAAGQRFYRVLATPGP